MNILAIDPGSRESSYVLVSHQNQELLEVDDITNEALLCMLEDGDSNIDIVLIEKIMPYGRIFGHELIDTIRFEGYLYQKCLDLGLPCHLISRKEYGQAIIGYGKVSDTTLYKALRLRFGKQLPVLSSTHRRSAFAMAVFWLDRAKMEGGESKTG